MPSLATFPEGSPVVPTAVASAAFPEASSIVPTAVAPAAGERFGFALFLALCLHGILILGVTFAPPERNAPNRPLEVVLLGSFGTAESEPPPPGAPASDLGQPATVELADLQAPLASKSKPAAPAPSPGTIHTELSGTHAEPSANRIEASGAVVKPHRTRWPAEPCCGCRTIRPYRTPELRRA